VSESPAAERKGHEGAPGARGAPVKAGRAARDKGAGGHRQAEWSCSKRQGHPSHPTEWELLQEGAVDRLRQDVHSQAASVAALKALVEKQMREQQEVATVLQAQSRVIMREVCIWTRGYLEIRLKDALGGKPACSATGQTPEAGVGEVKAPLNEFELKGGHKSSG
jgi:hypothetical protein